MDIQKNYWGSKRPITSLLWINFCEPLSKKVYKLKAFARQIKKKSYLMQKCSKLRHNRAIEPVKQAFWACWSYFRECLPRGKLSPSAPGEVERRPGDLDEVVRVVALVDEEPNLGNDVAEVGLVLAAADVKHPLQARQNVMPQPKKILSIKKGFCKTYTIK